MGKFLDLTGQTFNQLTVVRRGLSDNRGNSKYWCLCSCGNGVLIRSTDLKLGITKSCGCYMLKRNSETHLIHGHKKGGIRTSEYHSWEAMIKRCTNPNYEHWDYYVGRGITICERWLKFEHFITDMGTKPSPKHSIDRINTNGNYEPGNCKWSTAKEQAANRRPAAK